MAAWIRSVIHRSRPARPDVVVTCSASSEGPVGSTHVEVRTRWKAQFVEDLKATFLDQVWEGVFTPGEEVYPDLIAASSV